MSRRARLFGLVALALVSTCTGLQVARVEPHPPHAAALAVVAVTLFAAVLAAVARLTRSRP